MIRALIASVLLLVAGCGGGDDGPKAYSTEAVIEHFEDQTGDRPTPKVNVPGRLALLTFEGARLTDKYGFATIYVVPGDEPEKQIDRLLSSNKFDKVEPADEDGIQWTRTCPPRTVHLPCFFLAKKRFGRNVLLEWVAGRTKTTDARFERVAGVLANLP